MRWGYAFFVRPIAMTVPEHFPWESTQWSGPETEEKAQSLMDDLFSLGNEGWELVSVVSEHGWLMFFFKQPLSQ